MGAEQSWAAKVGHGTNCPKPDILLNPKTEPAALEDRQVDQLPAVFWAVNLKRKINYYSDYI